MFCAPSEAKCGFVVFEGTFCGRPSSKPPFIRAPTDTHVCEFQEHHGKGQMHGLVDFVDVACSSLAGRVLLSEHLNSGFGGCSFSALTATVSRQAELTEATFAEVQKRVLLLTLFVPNVMWCSDSSVVLIARRHCVGFASCFIEA